MLFYPAALPLSSQTLTHAAGVIRRHRARIGSPWRKLDPARQALLVLAYLRKGETFADLAAGFGIGTTTAWRYVTETVDLLAARVAQAAPGASRSDEGWPRPRGDRRHVSPHRPGRGGPAVLLGQAQGARHEPPVIATPAGDIVWVSGPLPGAVHDLAAARIWGILRELAASGLVVLADKGYHGAGEPLLIPYKGKREVSRERL